MRVKQSWMVFYIEAYIELTVSCIIAFDMFKIQKVWNYWDKFSVAVHFLGIASVVGFYIYIWWFTFYKIKPYLLKKKMERKHEHNNVIK